MYIFTTQATAQYSIIEMVDAFIELFCIEDNYHFAYKINSNSSNKYICEARRRSVMYNV